MVLTLRTVCIFIAAICFLIKAFSVNTGRIECMSLGFFFLVVGLLLAS